MLRNSGWKVAKFGATEGNLAALRINEDA